MNMTIKMTALALSCALLLPLAAGCKKEDEGQPKKNWAYNTEAPTEAAVPVPADIPTTSPEGADAQIRIDTSWQQNYIAEYTYFSALEEDKVDQRIREVRYDNVFLAEEFNSGEFEYFIQNGVNIDCYTVSEVRDLYVHTRKRNESISTIQSFFMTRSALNEEFSKKENVIQMDGEEYIAGRRCFKYVMRANREGSAIRTVFMWVDALYGNALKCLCYNDEEELVLSWEVSRFNVGTATNRDVSVDLAQYDFKEG